MEKTREIFYFYPEKYGYNPSTIETVHLIGEFNQWGKETQIIEEYKLTKDKLNRWIGIFNVPKGKGFYKFLLNKNTYVPQMELLQYSTVSTCKWAKDSIWYQIMIDRFYKGNSSIETPNLIPWDSPPDFFNNFGGDLQGIRQKIPYLKKFFGTLKDKAVYLNPVHKSTASIHKYWPEDFEAIDCQFGDEEDLKNLTEALHKEGAKIIIDLVYNHTGLNHYAFLNILEKGEKSIYFNWYRSLPKPSREKIEIPVLENYFGNKPQNLEIENDPREKTFNPKEKTYLCIWCGKYKFPVSQPEKFINASIEDIINNQPYYKLVHISNKPNYKAWFNLFELPELNSKSLELKQHLFDAAKKWMKLGIDGFRLDVPHFLNDAHQFWKEFRQQINEEALLQGKTPEDFYITGEIWGYGELANTYLYGDSEGKAPRFDSIMNYPFREIILNFYSGEILNPATDRPKEFGEITVSEMDKNIHDSINCLSWNTNQVQYNVFSSHDTRRTRTVLKDDRKYKATLIMQFTLPGSPAIYYGDEIGMTGGDDPENRASMRWNIYENLQSHPEELSIFNFYKKLIELKEKEISLRNGLLLTVHADDIKKNYVYARYLDNDNVTIVAATREGLKENLNIDISGLPFEDKIKWKNPITGKEFVNINRSITIQPEDMKESFGIVLSGIS